MSDRYPELQEIKKQTERRKAIASKVYDLLKENDVSISDGFEILDIAKRYISAAVGRAKLC